jgi:hypothetical protein
MAKLRKERRDRTRPKNSPREQKSPDATVKPSLQQRGVTVTSEVLLVLLAFWGYLRGVAPFISAPISYGGIGLIVAIFFCSHFILKKYPIRWVTDNREEFLSALPRKVKIWLVVISIGLLLPRAAEVLFPPPIIDLAFSGPYLYAPGFEVEGVNWERDFSEYTLRIKNNHKKVQILDLRAEMRLLAGFVKAGSVKTCV